MEKQQKAQGLKIEQKKPRGHKKENIEKNQAIISLHICGFNKHSISRLLKMDRWNISKIINKYLPRHLETILEREVKLITNKILKEKSKNSIQSVEKGEKSVRNFFNNW